MPCMQQSSKHSKRHLRIVLSISYVLCVKMTPKQECQLLQMDAVVIFMTERRCRLNVLWLVTWVWLMSVMTVLLLQKKFVAELTSCPVSWTVWIKSGMFAIFTTQDSFGCVPVTYFQWYFMLRHKCWWIYNFLINLQFSCIICWQKLAGLAIRWSDFVHNVEVQAASG